MIIGRKGRTYLPETEPASSGNMSGRDEAKKKYVHVVGALKGESKKYKSERRN
jgi:hypothetical protein